MLYKLLRLLTGGDDVWADIPEPKDERELHIWRVRLVGALFSFGLWAGITFVVGLVIALVGPWDWYAGPERAFRSTEFSLALLAIFGVSLAFGLLVAMANLRAASAEIAKAIREKRAAEGEE